MKKCHSFACIAPPSRLPCLRYAVAADADVVPFVRTAPVMDGVRNAACANDMALVWVLYLGCDLIL
ncbi:MAG: hypothetical protein IJW71_03360 [Clostridia bacterium]|nr:hypothetical protein [Clostridia bacterium]